jgi:hypothetical protein
MLEVSTILFIFLIFDLKLNYVNNLIHYYLVQVSARVRLFFSILLSLVARLSIGRVFLLLKLGVFPFHFWYLRLLRKLDWEKSFLLIRVSKLIVLVMVFNFMEITYFIFLACNLVFVVYSSLYEKRVKILLGLSSIFNIVWVLRRGIGTYIWLVYFLGYSLNLFLIVCGLEQIGKEIVSDSAQFFRLELCFFLGFNTFVLLGLPPFLRFFMKVIISRELVMLGWYYRLLVLLRIYFVYIYLIFFFNALSRSVDNIALEWKSAIGVYVLLRLVVNSGRRVGFLAFYYLDNRQCSLWRK